MEKRAYPSFAALLLLCMLTSGCSRQQTEDSVRQSAAGTSSTDSETSAYARAMADMDNANRSDVRERQARDFSSAEESSGASGASQRTAGSGGVDDATLAARVKAALADDSDLKTMGIGVRVEKGEVILSGTVNNQTQIDRAVKVTRAVDGVTTIGNSISIKR